MFDTVSKLFRDYAVNNPDKTALLYKDQTGSFTSMSWSSLHNLARQFGAGLIDLGAEKGDHIGIISDNRKEWIIADLGVLSIGCADVPRGADSTQQEVLYILRHADCDITLAENRSQTDKILSIKKDLPHLKTVIVMDSSLDGTPTREKGVLLLNFEDILLMGRDYLERNPSCIDEAVNAGEPADLATLIYTSGTTGEPKGVMLSHANYMHQIATPLVPLDIRDGDRFLSVLPIWHSFERAVEYVALFAGCSLAYSKPVSQILLEDMIKVRPTIFPSVPRIWEKVKQGIYRKINEEGGARKALFHFFVAVGTAHSKLLTLFRGLKPQWKRRFRILDALVSVLPLLLLTPFHLLGQALVFSKIKQRLGGSFRFGVSGGGALPPHVDDFFAAAGILLVEGYGLTETAPIVSVRRTDRPVPGTIGPPLPDVEVKVVDELGATLPPGRKGVLHVKGPNVMMGYYKRPEDTEKTISPDGWLNTGDLAMMTHRGEMTILGRVKETIVLLGGENIEPGPIEDTLKESPFIDQVMVVGQDQKYLAALIVPNQEELVEYAGRYGIDYGSFGDLISDREIEQLISGEVGSLVNPKRGFKLFERIHRIRLLEKPFEPGVEMTHSLKLKRDVIGDLYKKEIAALFRDR